VAPTALGGAKVLPGDGAEASPDEAEAAMARGHLLHLLLEHLPGTAPATWPALAAALIPDAAQRAELLAEAAGVLGDPGLAPLFAAGALSEVTVTGTWQGRALEGVIDRLIPGPEVVLAVDYKSNRLIPDDPAAVPEGYLRQMGAYAHLLAQVYPGRRIETAILWTRAPRLMRLSPDRVIAALGRATLP
jgi:ATP-dependent helicase/nuclease subunit A